MGEVSDGGMLWPLPGQPVWSSSGDRDLAAWIDGAGDFYPFVEGYRTAAEVLVAHVAAARDPDLLVYPVVFLWRHHLELRLKELIQRVHTMRDEPDDFPLTHRLLPLWQIVRSEVEKDAGTHNDCENTETVIRELDGLDPASMSFRYPLDRDGSPALKQALRVVSIDVLHEALMGVANFLDAVSCELSSRVDYILEMRRASLNE